MAACEIFSLCLFILTFTLVVGQKPSAVLFDQLNGKGNMIFTDRYIPDLNSEAFDNRAKSACVAGTWLFYEDSNYNSNVERRPKTEYIAGRKNFCTNLKGVGGNVSSLRYIGSPKNYTADSLTIYQYTFFQGKEEYVADELRSLENVEGEHQSIIITGTSDWIVFDQPNFQGNSICVKVTKSDIFAPTFIDDISNHASSPVPYGSIQSVRKSKSCTGLHEIKQQQTEDF